jgi:hypothetical protein
MQVIRVHGEEKGRCYAYEWNRHGDHHPFWGFGETPEEAKVRACWQAGDGWGREFGLADWQIVYRSYDRNGHTVTQTELRNETRLMSSFSDPAL